MKVLRESDREIELGSGRIVERRITLNDPPGFVTVKNYAGPIVVNSKTLPLDDPEGPEYGTTTQSGLVLDGVGLSQVTQTVFRWKVWMHDGEGNHVELWMGQDGSVGTQIVARIRQAVQRLVAAARVDEMTSGKEVDGLLGALDHPLWQVRKAAAAGLGLVASRRAIRPLFSNTGDKSPEVRAAARDALRQILSTDERILALRDGDPLVRSAGADLLEASAGERAVEPLRRALSDPDERVRLSAVLALGRIGSEGALEALAAAITHDEWSVRLEARELLEGLDEARFVQALSEALNHPDAQLRAEAAKDLAPKKDTLDLPALLLLLEHLDADPRSELSEYVVARRDLAGLFEALEHPDLPVRAWAAKILGEIGDAEAVEPLIHALEDAHPDVRSVSAYALGKIGDPRAATALVQALKDTQRLVRWQAVTALPNCGQAGVERPLIEALHDEAAEVRAHAALGLGKLVTRGASDGRQAVAPLIGALGDENVSVRYWAASTLGTIGDTRALPALREARKDRDRGVRVAVDTALEEIRCKGEGGA